MLNLFVTPLFHRAYFCTASAEVRATVGWTSEDEDLISHERNACVAYGLWHLPRRLWRDLRGMVMDVISAELFERSCHFES
eukprot:1897372-Amphidinium_carterae.5